MGIETTKTEIPNRKWHIKALHPLVDASTGLHDGLHDASCQILGEPFQ
jgi:hypothetical protein